MQRLLLSDTEARGRESERGAALVSTLLISTLLIAAGMALILTTGMTATTAIDSTAEMQAYYAAEAGLNTALDAIRGNVAASPALPANTMRNNFRAAVDPATSNKSSDPLTTLVVSGVTGVSRLSRWLNYTYPSSGLTDSIDPSATNRVVLSPPGTAYDPQTHSAFSITVVDPDDPTGATRTANPNYQPERLLLTSIGYGPRGATKHLEAMVFRTVFNFTPRSTITLRGATDGTAMSGFDPGSSNAKRYSGTDNYPSGQAPLPDFGVTNSADRTALDAALDGSHPDTYDDPKSTTLTDLDLDKWLQSASEARKLLTKLEALAKTNNRYFTSFPEGNAGTSTEPQLTFVKGNADVGPNFQGAGLLVVTGDLEMRGSTDFNGLILVLGNGTVRQNGGGNGVILGGIVVAKFNATGDFLAPTFNINGGGNSKKQYDSDWIRRSLDLAGRPVLGVVER